MSFSNHLENLILDNTFGKIWYCPQDLWLGLSKGDPLDDGTGLDEPWGMGPGGEVQTGGVNVVPSQGGWYWLGGAGPGEVPVIKGHWEPASGGELWDTSKGSYLWVEWGEDPPEAGGFPNVSIWTASGGWQMVSEVSGYERLHLSPDDWFYSSEGVVVNKANLTFPAAIFDWGTITHWVLFDAWWMTMSGELSPHKTINEGQRPSFGVQQLEIFIS